MAVTKQKAQAPVADQPFPAPAGCESFEKRGWIPATSLEWLEDLRREHERLADEWAAAVDAIAEARDDVGEAEAEYRAAVRAALAVGDAPPPRPPDLDATVRAARVEIAVEDAQSCRDDLSEFVLEVLAKLRARREELAPHLPGLAHPRSHRQAAPIASTVCSSVCRTPRLERRHGRPRSRPRITSGGVTGWLPAS